MWSTAWVMQIAVPQARLLVTHGHFIVNGRRTDVPSMLLSAGDVVTVREESRTATLFQGPGCDLLRNGPCPTWLSRDLKTLSGSVIRLPERSEIDGNLSEQLIVEYYSR